MTDSQDARLFMFTRVQDCITINVSIVAPLPGFTAFMATFNANTDQIQTISAQQRSDRSGVADSKAVLRTSMETQAVELARKLMAFATITNNNTLLAEINFSMTDFIRATDLAAKDQAVLVHQKSVINLAALATYGVTAAINASLLGSITAFQVSINKPQTSIDERRISTENLKVLFANNDKLLKLKMDILIGMLRTSNAEFYQAYTVSRKINDAATFKIALSGSITDKQTKVPMAGVVIKIAETGLSKKTTVKGNFTVQNISTGTYNLSMSKSGYKDLKQIIYVNDGETTKLIAEMEKVGE